MDASGPPAGLSAKGTPWLNYHRTGHVYNADLVYHDAERARGTKRKIIEVAGVPRTSSSTCYMGY